MNSIKNTFSIKDLENLTGIKAHTIRIWEKRYGLFTPDRSDTNIRSYSLQSLQNILNINLLYRNGVKISKISALSPSEIVEQCNRIASTNAKKNKVENQLKIAMLNFDTSLFESTYQTLSKDKTFGEVFNTYLVPFLREIGFLWQTDSILPAHEHFITALIKQKLMVSIEKAQNKPVIRRETFVLFLPENEIHDLGLLYLSYELLKRGCKVIYLGQSLPMRSLDLFLNNPEKTIFVSYCSVAPDSERIHDYVAELQQNVLLKCHSELWLLGNKALELDTDSFSDAVRIFVSVSDALQAVSIVKTR